MLLVPGERASQTASGTAESVAWARRWTAGQLVTAPQRTRDDVEVIVSEMATNAVMHTEGAYRVAVHLVSEAVAYIEVIDAGAGTTPQVQRPAEDAEGGRGLAVVQALADGWGTQITAEGERLVWALIRWTPAPLPRRSDRTSRPLYRGDVPDDTTQGERRDVVAYAA